MTTYFVLTFCCTFVTNLINMKTPNFLLAFGKHKGQMFLDTPKSYQQWLLSQEWFKVPTITSNESYALIENGVIHSDDLSLEDATEMKERHHRCFPNCNWEILPMSATIGMDKAEGMLERHARISARYF